MLADLKMGPIVQVVCLHELTPEEKESPGMIKWHGRLPEAITHEGWISDGEQALHAWFHRACFSGSRIGFRRTIVMNGEEPTGLHLVLEEEAEEARAAWAQEWPSRVPFHGDRWR